MDDYFLGYPYDETETTFFFARMRMRDSQWDPGFQSMNSSDPAWLQSLSSLARKPAASSRNHLEAKMPGDPGKIHVEHLRENPENRRTTCGEND